MVGTLLKITIVCNFIYYYIIYYRFYVRNRLLYDIYFVLHSMRTILTIFVDDSYFSKHIGTNSLRPLWFASQVTIY